MRWGLIALATAGCNQWFGIDGTQLIDAPPPIDAAPPPVCPALGQVPTFGADLHTVAARSCDAYSTDRLGGAAAMCLDKDTKKYQLATGVVDGTLAPQLLNPAPSYTISGVHLTPEGDSAFIDYYDYEGGLYTPYTGQYARGEGTWTMMGAPLTFPAAAGDGWETSTPSSGPNRRIMVSINDANFGLNLVEYAIDGTTVSEVRRTPYTDLGVTSLRQMSLTPDGLRLVFRSFGDLSNISGGTGGIKPPKGDTTLNQDGTVTTEPLQVNTQPVYYMDRASIDDPFGIPKIITSIPDEVSWPHMTADCGRIYFEALNTIWYLEQVPPAS